MQRRWRVSSLVCAAVALAVVPLHAQERTAQEVQERLRELREEMRELERDLARLQGGHTTTLDFTYSGPRILALSSSRARLGVFVQTRLDDDTDAVGAMLERVEPNGPAERAGLKAGDIIVSFNGERLAGRYPPAGPNESEPARKLIDLVREMEPGDEVKIEYRRGNQNLTTTAKLEEGGLASWFDETPFGSNDFRVQGEPGVRSRVQVLPFGDSRGFVTIFGGPWFDIELVTLNEDLGRYFGTNEGLLVIRPTDDPNVDLRAGDVIMRIGGREPRTPSSALRILRSYEPGETIQLEILREKERQTVSVTVPEPEFRMRSERS